MAGEKGPIKRSTMDIKRLASLIQRGTGRLLVIDSRTFSEYNASHVQGAVNVCCSKLVKRRLQQDKVSVTELLQPNGKVKVELGRKQEVVVYDQSSKEAGHLSKDGFVHILMGKLEGTFHKVSLLTGIFTFFLSPSRPVYLLILNNKNTVSKHGVLDMNQDRKRSEVTRIPSPSETN
ncbi:hypothetical protein INR49_030145, partial [Caranx melampygus]